MRQRVTEEQIRLAKSVDLISYMKQYEPQELIRTGPHDYKTTTHSSLCISDNGLWHWFSHGVGGRGALNYLIQVKGMDFVSDGKVPPEVMEMRGRTPLLEAENRIFDEKIILYRKLVYIDGQELAKYDEYRLSGINDILRLHFGRFTLKMDDPQTPLRRLRDDGSVEVIYTDRIYYINFVMQFRYGAGSEYKRFRLVVTRNGILSIEEMN